MFAVDQYGGRVSSQADDGDPTSTGDQSGCTTPRIRIGGTTNPGAMDVTAESAQPDVDVAYPRVHVGRLLVVFLVVVGLGLGVFFSAPFAERQVEACGQLIEARRPGGVRVPRGPYSVAFDGSKMHQMCTVRSGASGSVYREPIPWSCIVPTLVGCDVVPQGP